MLAVVAHDLKKVRCDHVPVLEPEHGRVLVRNILASICGSDLHIIYGGFYATEFPLLPGRPGHEAVGEVVANGGSHYQPGDLVLTVPKIWNARAFAEFQLIEPEQLIKLPNTKPVSHLLMAQQLGTVVFGCRKLPDVSGKTVVVIGQGSVGLFHDFILRKMGAKRIIVIEPIPERLAAAQDMKVDHTISETGPDATESILELTGGEGADIVIEAVGSTATLNQAIEIAKPWGHVAAFGLPDSMGLVPFHWAPLYIKSLTLSAVHSGQDVPGLPDFHRALELILKGEINMSPFVKHQFPITEVQKAFNVADSKSDGALKVSLSF